MFARKKVAQTAALQLNRLAAPISSAERAFVSSTFSEVFTASRSVGGGATKNTKVTFAKISAGFAAAGLMTTINMPSARAEDATTSPSGGVATATPPTSSDQKYKVVFVLGGPGSGKGTQSAKLVEEFGVAHLSAGDLLRAHMKSGTPDGQMVAEMIAQGQIVPSHVTISLLQAAMDASGNTKFLIDGFPRNEENRSSFEKQTGIEPTFVLFFDCPEEVMEQRLLGRNEGRTDDNIETIRKRFRVFLESSIPVVEYYEKSGKVAKISATRPPEEVYKEVRRTYIEFMT